VKGFGDDGDEPSDTITMADFLFSWMSAAQEGHCTMEWLVNVLLCQKS
jgi:hypothetical protein